MKVPDRVLRLIRPLIALPVFRAAARGLVKLLVPRHRVGVGVVIFDADGRFLLLEHTVRIGSPWGLPGGWLESGEDPADGARRELREELALDVAHLDLLLCEKTRRSDDLLSGNSISVMFAVPTAVSHERVRPRSLEILSTAWYAAGELPPGLLRAHRKAIEIVARDRRAGSQANARGEGATT